MQADPRKLPHTLVTGADGKKYQTYELTGEGTRNGETGRPWRGYDVTKMGRHWGNLHAAMDDLDARGLIHWPKKPGGFPRRRDEKPFEPEDRTVTVGDLWTDIDRLNQTAKERTGYPTQKPVALLERIIAASSKPGDVVLDPFCGCGTAIVASQKMQRRWVGIDVTHLAVSVLKRRLDEQFPNLTFRVRGEPEDAASARRLAKEKPLEFQAWIVDKVGGIPISQEKEKKVAKGGGDEGRDGIVQFRDDPKAERSKRMLISVKGGESYINKPEIVDTLGGSMKRHGAALGVLLMSHKPSDGTYRRATGYLTWSSETYAPDRKYPVIQIVTVDDIFAPGWRGLSLPGENTSGKSQPPPGTPGASEELFDATGQPKRRAPGIKKTSERPVAPGQIPIPGVPEEFRMIAEKTSTKRRK